jgi:hypothetical protein
MPRLIEQEKTTTHFFTEIKAERGYKSITLHRNIKSGAVEMIDVIPVMFWAFEAGTYALYPVTLAGVKINDVFIITPTGFVIRDHGNEIYKSYSEFLKAMKAERAAVGGWTA